MNAPGRANAEPTTRTGRPAVRAMLLATLALTLACGVSRPASQRLPGPAALPNLRRASEAQLDRIAIETAHVESLDQQLAALRAKEDRLYTEVIAAEQAYQRLQGDFDGVQADVSAVDGELAAVRGELAAAQAELDELRTQLAVAQGDLARARAEAEASAAQLAAIREMGELDAGEREAWIARLERRRAAMGVEPGPWTMLLVELGLADPDALPSAEGAADEPSAAERGEETPPPAEGTSDGGDDQALAPEEGAPAAGVGGEAPDPPADDPAGPEPPAEGGDLAPPAGDGTPEGAGEDGPEPGTGPPDGSSP